MFSSRFRSCLLMVLLLSPGVLSGDEEGEKKTDGPAEDVLAGHSYHGEAFNEGPRQRAYLMDGLGRVRFPVTTDDAMAQRFVTQGVAQVHGFWYLEAERSFRQAAAIDSDCAMAYWGMALANKGSAKRAKGFIAEAVKRKGSASQREQRYIDALNDYLTADPKKKKKERAQKYARALEKMIYDFPEDHEAKAFLALQLWANRSSGLPISSYLAIDALLGQVLQAEPMHPVHHYRIHLWDYEKPARALASAANCGQSLPAIAHMWHMPGHTYSRVKRYNDAAWQQEASARVDHAHMMRDKVLPDQISNFAHNNEWLIRNLNHVGRIQDAVALAKNMIELPRHPKYNVLSKRGSTQYGRTRLFETLSRYELWEELISLCNSPYLEPTDDVREQTKRLRHLGRANFRMDDPEGGAAQIEALRAKLAEQKEARDKAGEEAETKAKQTDNEKATEADDGDNKTGEDKQKEGDDDKQTEDKKTDDKDGDPNSGDSDRDDEQSSSADGESQSDGAKSDDKAQQKAMEKAVKAARKPFDTAIRELEKALHELEGLQAVTTGDAPKGYGLLKKAGGVDPGYLAHVRFAAGKVDEAIKAAQKHVKSHENEVQPLAMLCELLWKADKKDAAQKSLDRLRELSDGLDLESPVFQRLGPLIENAGYPADWRVAKPPADDVGVRPSLDSLGPFRWQPSTASDWVLTDATGDLHSLMEYRGRPVVVIFYLGYGCLHCAEQLQAFAPEMDRFREAGLELVAISTDTETDLKHSIDNYNEGSLPIPLLSDHELNVFKAYRAYDDFESQPLHGTFLIDGNGLVRWQDISYEPFMDPDFVLSEAQRLLSQSSWTASSDNVAKK